jgi:hypothetical protein
VARRFRRTRRGITVGLDDGEVDLLVRLFDDVAEMLAPVVGDDEDPLVEMVGISSEARTPDDPALARLLPDASRDDAEAAAEFRRFTERGLRTRKHDALRTASASLGRGSPAVLSDAEATAWLTSLTDVRLVLAERLGLRTDSDAEALYLELEGLDVDDPRAWLGAVYDFLTWLQEGLAEVLLAGLPSDDCRPA